MSEWPYDEHVPDIVERACSPLRLDWNRTSDYWQDVMAKQKPVVPPGVIDETSTECRLRNGVSTMITDVNWVFDVPTPEECQTCIIIVGMISDDGDQVIPTRQVIFPRQLVKFDRHIHYMAIRPGIANPFVPGIPSKEDEDLLERVVLALVGSRHYASSHGQLHSGNVVAEARTLIQRIKGDKS